MFHKKFRGGCEHRFAHGPFGRGLFGRHRGGMGRGFGARRLFEQGDLRFIILHLLAEKPRHGYEIIKALEDRFGGMYSPSPGVIYPTLTLLYDLGYARAADVDGKKLAEITEEGRAFLAENKAMLDEVLGRLEEASRGFAGGPPPEIRRAVHNFKHALSIRLSKGPLSELETRDIAAAIDAASAAIQRT